MKTKFIILLTVIAFVSAGCKHNSKENDSNTITQQENIIAEESVDQTNNNEGMSSPQDFGISLNNIQYNIPCSIDVLLDNGWDFDYDENPDNNLAIGQEKWTWLVNEQQDKLQVLLTNYEGGICTLKKSSVAGLRISQEWWNVSSGSVVVFDTLQRGVSTAEDLKSAFDNNFQVEDLSNGMTKWIYRYDNNRYYEFEICSNVIVSITLVNDVL